MAAVMHSRIWEGQEARLNPICASSCENTNLATLHFCFSRLTLLVIPYTHHSVLTSFACTQDMFSSRKSLLSDKTQFTSSLSKTCDAPYYQTGGVPGAYLHHDDSPSLLWSDLFTRVTPSLGRDCLAYLHIPSVHVVVLPKKAIAGLPSDSR